MAKSKRCPAPRTRKQWFEKPEGIIALGFTGSLIAGIVVYFATKSRV